MLVGEEENLEQVGVTGTQSGILSGRFLDQNNSPITNHPIQLFYDYSTSVLKTSITDANGNFKFDSLFPGTYAIEIDHLGKKQRVPKLIVDAGEHNKVELITGKATTYQRYNSYNQPVSNFTALSNNNKAGLVNPNNPGTFFDGKTMVQATPMPHYKIDTGMPFTFEAKIKADTFQLTYPAIFSSRDEEGFLKSTLIFLWDTKGVPVINVGPGGNICVHEKGEGSDEFTNYYTTSPNLVDGKWHHIVITRDTVNLTLYVDQKSVCNAKTARSLDLDNAISIGGDRASRYNTYFHGYIKDLRIWTSFAKDIDEFTTRNINGNEPDLLGFWPLDSSLTNPLIDYSLNQNHGFWSE